MTANFMFHRTSSTLFVRVLVNKYFINKKNTHNIQQLQASLIQNSDKALPLPVNNLQNSTGFENSIISPKFAQKCMLQCFDMYFVARHANRSVTGAPYVQHTDAIQPLEQNQFCFWLETFCLVEPKVYNIFAAQRRHNVASNEHFQVAHRSTATAFSMHTST